MSDLFYDKLNIDDVVEEPYSDSFDDDFDDGLEYEQADGAFDDDYDVVESDSLDIADTADFFDNVDDGLASALENVSFAEEESSIDEDAFNEYDNIDDSLLLEDDSLVNGYVDDYEETSTDGQSEALVDGELQPLPKGEALDDHQVDEQVIDQALLDELISQVDNQALLENSSKSEFKQVDGVFQDVKKIKTIEGPLQVFSIGRPTKKRKKAKKRIEGVYDSRNLHKDANGIDEVVLAQNIDIEKENKKRELRTLSKQIMEEDSNGVNIAKEPSVELIKEGKSVDNMEASNNQPFMNIKAKANHAVGGVAVASVSPFLTPACIYKKDVKGQDVVQATDRNLEQAPNETALELAPENDKNPIKR